MIAALFDEALRFLLNTYLQLLHAKRMRGGGGYLIANAQLARNIFRIAITQTRTPKKTVILLHVRRTICVFHLSVTKHIIFLIGIACHPRAYTHTHVWCSWRPVRLQAI